MRRSSPAPKRDRARPTPVREAAPATPTPAPRPGSRTWVIAGACLAALLLLLHGSVLLWSFVSDDFVFLAASRDVGRLFTSFDVYSNYFRPIGRELYFLAGWMIAGNRPLPWHLFNFATLVAAVVMVVHLGHRLAGARAGLFAGAVYALLYSQRMVMAWVSCSQDLFAAFFGLLSAHALLSRHRVRGGAWHLAALLSKESVAAWPLVWGAWRALAAPAGTPWRGRVAIGARESAPLWAATAAWAAIVLTVRAVRRAWAQGTGTTLADVSLSLGSLWEGLRSTLLSYFALEQPWDAIARVFREPGFPWGQAAIVVAALVALVGWSRTLPGAGAAPAAGRAPELGALWAVVGAVPVALAGHHFSAYYITYSGIGFALLAGRMLAQAPPLLAATGLVAGMGLGLAANRVGLYNIFREEPVAGVSYITITRLDFERVYLDSLHAALDRARPARGGRIYLTHAPRLTRFVTMDGRAPKVWFDDPDLELRTVGEYHPPESRPHVFLRFDPATWGFVAVPSEVMDANLAAEAAMTARRPEEARVQLDRAFAALPPRGLDLVRLDLWNNRGAASVALGDSAAARAAWRQALALDPTFAAAALNLANFEAEAGHFAAARATLEQLLGHVPASGDALKLLVRVQRAQGDLAAAQATWTRLAAVDPAQANALTP